MNTLVAVFTGQAAPADGAPRPDVVPFAGLTAAEACAQAGLPVGFQLHAFASEPDLVQPIAFCLDDWGRVWVAEGRTYPKRRGHPPKEARPAGADLSLPSDGQLADIFGGADRILVFADTDGDHRFDTRTVFLENLNLVSGLEVGFGGVWIGAAPYLMFVPVRDWAAPKPAGNPRILLDGWNYSADTHETLNTFAWGPDGWLYGCHGVFCPSHVGRPGAAAADRQWCDAAVWRYHPTRHAFEIFTEGGSNPWGIDFDEHGQLFAEMCVIPHFWHMIQGARIQRQGGQHYAIDAAETRRYATGSGKPVHPHIYEDIQQHGDHVHWAGQGGPHAGNARSAEAGGGHAHAGLMCYLGASWPAEYRGRMFMGNIHGQRLNMDYTERAGSGYVGKHGPDFLNFNDAWSQTLNQLYDHDGSVYVIDWYDKNQCHHNREDGHDRGNGRIYKIVYRNEPVTRLQLADLNDAALVELVDSTNEFLSRHARRRLQERAAARGLAAQLTGSLRRRVREAVATPARLRALWTLHVTGGFDAATAIAGLQSPDEWIRAWTIQLAFESPMNLSRLVREAADAGVEPEPDIFELAERDPSPVVRRFLASAAQRGPNDDVRARLVRSLLTRAEDARDHNIPLLCWFALEPLVADYPEPSLTAALETKLPRILQFTARRIAALDTPGARDLIAAALAATTDPAKHQDLLGGLDAALQGRRHVPMPAGWERIEASLSQSAHAGVRTLAQTLSLKFGSPGAVSALRRTLTDFAAPAAARQAALESLVGVQDASLPATLQRLLADAVLRGAALRALAGFSDPNTPESILAVYAEIDPGQQRDALNTLVSRPAYARPLLAAVKAGRVPKNHLTADLLRQLRRLQPPDLQQQMTMLFGTYRESSADAKAAIEKYRRVYHAGGSQPGNASAGRLVFHRVCVQCHTLFDEGGKVGPDITGANRTDLDYLLETIVDPNAVIPNEYRSTEIETADGRSLTGIVRERDATKVVLQTANELLTLPSGEIESERQTELSMMPEELLSPLTDQEVRDLIYYLTRPGQAPLPAAP